LILFAESHAKKYIKTLIEKMNEIKNKNNPFTGDFVLVLDAVTIELIISNFYYYYAVFN
tara:strand:+ start:1456 stop:1632 length:177 start_codon:yes stop_codon:yes gene_type:complete